jgi:succinoglycan biosynthesis protein ExoO
MKDTSPTDLEEQSDFWISPCQKPDDDVAVTVVIPSYNAATTLSRAVRSVLTQTRPDFEIIIADDASTDLSWDLITEWLGRDPRIRALRNTVNAGKPIGMNRAVSVARGKWLAVLDADDWFHPKRLATLVAAGDKHGVDMVADNQSFFDTGANVVVGHAWPEGRGIWPLSFEDFLIGANPYDSFNLGMLKPVMRTEFLRTSGLNYEKRARQGQDFLYLLQFYLLGGKALVSDEPAYYYTQPYGTISQVWSHTARRRYDFQTAFEINETYVQAAEKQITPEQLSHLAMRSQRLKTLESYYAAKDLIAQGCVKDGIRRVMGHPAALEYAARRFLVKYCGLSTGHAAATVAARSKRNMMTTAAQT